MTPLVAVAGALALVAIALVAGNAEQDRLAEKRFSADGTPTPIGVLFGLGVLGYPVPKPGEMLLVAVKNDHYQRQPGDPPDPWIDWLAHIRNDGGKIKMRISRATVRPGNAPGSNHPPTSNAYRVHIPQYRPLAYSGGRHPRPDPDNPDKVTRPALRQVASLWIEVHDGGGRWVRLQQSRTEGGINQHGTRPGLSPKTTAKNGIKKWLRACLVTLDWRQHEQNLAFFDWRDDFKPRYHFAAISTQHIRARR